MPGKAENVTVSVRVPIEDARIIELLAKRETGNTKIGPFMRQVFYSQHGKEIEDIRKENADAKTAAE